MKAFFALALIVVIASASYLDNAAVSKDMIEKINNTPGVHWKAGYNAKFSKLTLREASKYMGTVISKDRLEEVDNVNDDIPAEFDARKQWPQCKSIGTIRDQSVCGSCWAFGAAEAWTDRVCIHQNFMLPLSSEDILTCCGYSCGNGCNGGQLSGAWSYIKKTGLVTGGLYGDKNSCDPYYFAPCDHHVNGTLPPCGSTQPTPKCVKTCQSSYPHDYEGDKHKASKSYAVSSKVAAIQTEIMTNGPVEAAFSVYSDFLTYRSGVYHHVSGSYLGGHAIKILGWGREDNMDYWLVANSWNEEWGNEGYFKILRGSDHMGIESEIYAGMP